MIAVARRVGDRVRAAPNACGERTGSDVAERPGTVVDMLPEEDKDYHERRYWVRLEDRTGQALFFDWIAAGDLRDY